MRGTPRRRYKQKRAHRYEVGHVLLVGIAGAEPHPGNTHAMGTIATALGWEGRAHQW